MVPLRDPIVGIFLLNDNLIARKCHVLLRLRSMNVCFFKKMCATIERLWRLWRCPGVTNFMFFVIHLKHVTRGFTRSYYIL